MLEQWRRAERGHIIVIAYPVHSQFEALLRRLEISQLAGRRWLGRKLLCVFHFACGGNAVTHKTTVPIIATLMVRQPSIESEVGDMQSGNS